MKTKMKKKGSLLLAIMMILSLAFSSIVYADTSNSKVLEARDGVLRVGVYHLDRESGVYTLIKSGSGFLIGDDDAAGISTVITNFHVVHLNDEETAEAKAYLGTDTLNLVVRVAVKRDTCIDATELNSSESADFAILTLNTPIYTKNSLKFAVDEADPTQEVYALGFPGILTYVQDENSYTKEDVNVTKGTVSKITDLSALSYIQHDADLTEGNSGGPLVDANGNIIGINVSGLTDANVYYSLCASEIIETLEMLGIPVPYPDGGTVETETPPTEETTEPTEEAELDTADLEDAIDGLGDYKEESYTEDSYADYKAAVEAGEEVLDSATTQDEIDDAVAAIEDAELELKEVEAEEKAEKSEGMPTWIIIVIVGAVVVVIVVIIIVVAVSGKGKNNPPVQTPSRPPVAPPPVAPMGGPGSDATTVLSGGGDAPTTMLSGGAQTMATLVRLRTSENISIGKQVFGLGKDQSRVDYCISGNSSISRRHAEIRVKNGAFYLVDLNSTNGTYLNGQRVQPNQEMILKNTDRIKISDEEFQFKM